MTPEERSRVEGFIGGQRLLFVEARGGLCDECGGAGIKLYSSTATWRGGCGGQAFTADVCDVCWGSGAREPWPSHRRIQ
jgi:hypothetical protein